MDPSIGDGAVCTQIEELTNIAERSTPLDYVRLANWKNVTVASIQKTYPKYDVNRLYAGVRITVDPKSSGEDLYIVEMGATTIIGAIGRLVIEDRHFIDTSRGIPSVVGVAVFDD